MEKSGKCFFFTAAEMGGGWEGCSIYSSELYQTADGEDDQVNL